MASPAPDTQPNGISTPPATAPNAANPSPPTQSSTQPNTQQPLSQVSASFPPTSLQDSGTSKRPRDARLIHMLLAQMGVHVYTERVPLQLLDFAYRYTSSILSDAQSYEPPLPHHPAGGSKKRNAAATEDDGVSLNALRTAVAARAAGQFSASLPKEFMAEMASERNRIALPRVEREYGIRLPPERYCFTGKGWGVRERWEEEVEEEDAEDEDMEIDGGAVGVGGVGFGGPVGGVGVNGTAGADAEMGGMEEEEIDQQEFEDAMGN
ncbi:transcription initiation factor IID, 31kD subunit-domain-containing protein [Paraphoma chrysanthemicola]|uniref:Transcription initiation factor IID, 31kD subunit-domain-containing protein n=1 Tax=Paraphoma chrysanthemicola TaxID=798071 RepID=A0A8K0VXP7_9PLEO|nr:transcription initiation factor IID, 31kD subunit-domain-containing protein [Paraphoma chrysanthemicola]